VLSGSIPVQALDSMSRYIPTKRAADYDLSDEEDEFTIGFQPDDRRQQLLKRHANGLALKVGQMYKYSLDEGVHATSLSHPADRTVLVACPLLL
jgi:hypothetical protein